MSGEAIREAWGQELRRPSEAFFGVLAAQVRSEGAEAATVAAVEALVPAVDWQGYLPHVPHGLLGTWAVWALRPLLQEGSFLRVLATQLHGFAREARDPKGSLAKVGAGSGNWANIASAVAARRPSLAWGECLGMARPVRSDFDQVLALGAPDMANVGHKAVGAWAMGELAEALGGRVEPSRLLLGQAAWLTASEPMDRFWHQRATTRFGAQLPRIPVAPAGRPEAHAEAVREICDFGLVDLLDAFCARLAAAPASGDLLGILALAAAEKQLDARRDLEGKTAWTWCYLAALAEGLAPTGDPRPYVQAAALINLFPSDEPEERVQPKAPREAPADPGPALLDAILDGEPREAMFLARRVEDSVGAEDLLRILAEAAAGNDPAFNYSHQVLAVAAASRLRRHLPPAAASAMLMALAKFLANSQGSADLTRLAGKALGHRQE